MGIVWNYVVLLAISKCDGVLHGQNQWYRGVLILTCSDSLEEPMLIQWSMDRSLAAASTSFQLFPQSLEPTTL